MSHAFAKDSHTCAACVSWGGERMIAPDQTLVHVQRYSVEGECRTAVSQDYRKITRAGHTCGAWSPLPLLKSHGARPTRTPGPSAAMAGMLAAAAPRPAQPEPSGAGAPNPLDEPGCRSAPLDIDKAPPQARVLFAHWRRVKQARALPPAHELDTAQMRDAVPRLCLFEPVRGTDGAVLDFLYRACGRSVQRRLGTPAAGRTIRTLHPADAAERLIADLAACRASGEPRCLLVAGDAILPGQRFVELLLPLAGAEGRPGPVLAYRHLPGG